MHENLTLIRPAMPHELPDLAQFVVEAYSGFAPRLTEDNWTTMHDNLRRTVLRPGNGIPLVVDVNGMTGGFVV